MYGLSSRQNISYTCSFRELVHAALCVLHLKQKYNYYPMVKDERNWLSEQGQPSWFQVDSTAMWLSIAAGCFGESYTHLSTWHIKYFNVFGYWRRRLDC
jgi:hypothetical protein